MRTTRIAVTGALAAAGLLLAGCGGTGGGNSPSTTEQSQPAKPSALASVDPCTVVPPDELKSFGVTKPGKFVDQGIGEPGCDFKTGDYLLTIYKAENSDLAYWQGRRDNFGIFEPNKVGSHEGIKAVTRGSVGQGLCRQIIAAGGGSVSVAIKYDADKIQSDDATCAKAMEIAQVVEPKLPK
ncbi:DUF3558 family protein [Saccharopolyspora shandongensis]|uniref:DUF3558 family protein n=1 Tax=Saccharopolyspora shandongensis TaxID=418495 RepID=UPI003426BAAB